MTKFFTVLALSMTKRLKSLSKVDSLKDQFLSVMVSSIELEESEFILTNVKYSRVDR